MNDPTIQRMYDDGVKILNAMIADRERHVAATPDCPAAPMCFGGDAMMAMQRQALFDPDFYARTLLTALGELSDARRRLEAQRQATESETIRADRAEEEVRDMRAQAEFLRDELDAYEEAEEILRGVQVIREPPDPE